MTHFVWTALLAALLLPTQEKDNPEYEYWAGCKPGSWVKNRIEMENQGKKIEYESVTRLTEVTADKVVLEIFMKMKTEDRAIDSPPKRHEIKSKAPPKGKTVTERDEEISISGKTLKCRYHEMETEAAEKKPKVNLKAWMTKDIPGGVAKSEVLSDGMKVPIRTVALEWDKQ
jgi:hypothetical protein